MLRKRLRAAQAPAAGCSSSAAIALSRWALFPVQDTIKLVRCFAFTRLVGIVAGTHSTVFVASAIAIVLGQRSRRQRWRRAMAPAPVLR